MRTMPLLHKFSVGFLILTASFLPFASSGQGTKNSKSERKEHGERRDKDRGREEEEKNKTPKQIEHDAMVEMAWHKWAFNQDLSFKEIVQHCDSIFAREENKEGGEDGEYAKYAKWKGFWGTRLDASSGKLHNFNKDANELYNPAATAAPTIPSNHCSGGGEELQSNIQNKSSGGPEGYGWNWIGPQNVYDDPQNSYIQALGRVTGISVNPANHSEIYAASEWGGLWKTSNGGATWDCVTDNLQPSNGAGVVAFDVDYSASPYKIYVALGYPHNNTFPWFYYLTSGGRSYGIFYSLDNGNSFYNMTGLTSSPLNIDWNDDVIGDIKINPGNHNYVFFTSKFKIARLDVSSLTTTTTTPSSITAIYDLKPSLPTAFTNASSGMGQIEFLPGSTTDMFVNSLITAHLFHVSSCTGSFSVTDVTNNLSSLTTTNLSDFNTNTDGWDLSGTPAWSYSGSDVRFDNNSTAGAGTASLKTNIFTDYLGATYSVSFDVTIPPNTSLVVKLVNTSAGTTQTLYTGGPTSLISVSPISYTAAASTSSSNNSFEQLVFEATSNSGYNPSSGAIIVDNIRLYQRQINYIGMSTTNAAPNNLYVLTGSFWPNFTTDFQVTGNSGSSFSSITTGQLSGGIRMSTVNSDLTYFGHSGVYFFSYDASTNTVTDLGTTFMIDQYGGHPAGHTDVRSFIVSEDPLSPGNENIFVGEDGGLSGFISGTWRDLTSGTHPGTPDHKFSSSLAYGIGSSIHNGNVSLATQDNSILTSNYKDFTEWKHEGGGDCYEATYGKRPATNNNYFFTLNGGGGPYDLYGSSLPGYMSINDIHPFTKIKSTPNGEYVAGDADIYSYYAPGFNWVKITSPLAGWPGDNVTTPLPPTSDHAIFGFSPDAVDLMYFAAYLPHEGNIWSPVGDFATTSNGGMTWNVNANTTGKVFIDMAVDPKTSGSSKRLWAGAAWYDAPGTRRVFESIDDGANWHDMSTGLPDGPINALVYDEQSEYLFAGTDFGVYAMHMNAPPSARNSGDWKCFSLNLPNAFVTGLDINRCTGKLYVSTYGRGAYQAELPPDMNWDNPADVYSTDVITTNQFWTADRDQTKSIVVEPGVTLTIQNCTLNMGRNKNITIKSADAMHPVGGTLIVDHATITNNCGSLWGTISVEGDGNPQDISNLPANFSNEGLLVLKNNSVLENAYIGIVIAGQYYDGSDQADYDPGSHDGGLVVAENTTFHNLVHGVWVGGYSSAAVSHTQNSSFKSCTFLNDNFLQSKHYTNFSAGYGRRFGSKVGIIFYGVSDGTVIDDCTFRTDLSNPAFQPDEDLRGNGISAFNADFEVVNCRFENLTKGIEAYNDVSVTNAPFVSDNTFTNNWRAATFSAVNNAVFKNNNITVGLHCQYPTPSTPFNLEAYGAYFSQLKGAFIYNNTISLAGSSTWSSYKTYGIIVNNTNNPTTSGAGAITLYKNVISTDIGICAYQDNRNTQIQCNTLTGCGHHGISVWGPNSSTPGRLSTQGINTSTGGAGNTFFTPSGGCAGVPYHIASGYMNPPNDFNYFQFSSTNHPAVCVSSSAGPYIAVNTGSSVGACVGCCPSLSEPTFAISQHKGIAGNYEAVLDSCDQAIAQLRSQIDGGNTAELLKQVQSSSMKEDEVISKASNSAYLSDTVLLSLVNRAQLPDYQKMRPLLLRNSQLSHSVWMSVTSRYPQVATDADLLNLQSTPSGRENVDYQISKQTYVMVDALNEIRRNYGAQGNWNAAAEIFARRKDYVGAITLYLQGKNYKEARSLALNISDPDYRKLVNIYVDHFTNTPKGLKGYGLDSMNADEKKLIAQISTNPYSHAGEIARYWLCHASGADFSVVMPFIESGDSINAVNTNSHLAGYMNSKDQINVYPNPAQNVINVSMRGSTWETVANITVYDMEGKKIVSTVPNSTSGIIVLNTTEWVSGNYMLIINKKDGAVISNKVVIEHQ